MNKGVGGRMLDNINFVGKGFAKKWIYSKNVEYELACDYLQKINYCIQDFNHTVQKDYDRGNICFLILLVTWIQEAYKSIEELVLVDLRKKFVYKDEALAIQCNHYIGALRSFVVAHPLSTSRHEKYSLNGDYICVDISTGPISPVIRAFKQEEKFYHLSVEGLKKSDNIEKYDYRLYVYDKKENAEFFKYFGCTIEELEIVAKVYISKLRALDLFLSHQKKKDYISC